MDSPESSKIIAAPSSASASPAPQESPFLSYLRSLSPIHPPKVARITRGFSDLNIPTPPPVFTSPRLNPQSETIFLKRSLHPHLSSSELSRENEDRSNAYTEGSDVSGLPVKNLIDSLDSSPQKGCDNKDSMLVQPSSPLACFDEYLANPVEMNGANSSGSDDICMKQNKDAVKSSGSHCTRLSEATLTLDDAAHQVMKDMESQMAAKRTPLNLADEKLQEKPVLVVKSVNKNDDQVQSGVISDQINDTVVSGSSLEPGAKNCQHLETEGAYQQSAEGGQNGERSYKPPVLRPIEACQNRDEHSLMVFQGSVENRECNLEEAGQSQRGARRRCLQFEAAEARRKSTGKSHCISNPANLVPLSRLPPIQTEMGLLDSSHLDLATKDCNPVINSSQAMVSKLDFCSVQSLETHASKIDGSVRNRESTPRKAPLSSGIGLHLNSIVNAAAMGSSVALSTNSTEKDCPVAQREKSPAQLEQHLVDESKSSSLPRSISTCGSGDQKEIQATVTESSAVFQCPREKVDRCEEFNPPSPKKNRKRPFHTGENEGCKRCNCRRSKCLKLYCECFAAGIYCAEPCACQECFNKPEYEDTVLETRQQIESRNPLAFAPKVVRRVSGSPANSVDDKNRVTPSSARHKRGCNCKKSMCLKKYCECYQAGVGCSDGCRCEGCKNIFGAKEGYGELREMVYKRVDDRSCEDLSDRKQVEEARRDLVQSEHCHPHNLTPVTPLFQRSHHGKGVSKSQFPAPSSESDTNTSSYVKSPTSSRCLDIHDSRAKMSEGNLDLVFYDQELELSATGKVGQFSPRWDGLENLCDLTPLPKPPSRVTNVSTSSNTTNCTKVSRVQLQGSNRLSGSLQWRSSPITPMSQLGGNKFYQGPSGSGYDIVGDDTPDILKDAQTPIQAVKASSPNQKRVSPPHAQQNSLRSSASPGLKSGRKFVLQSISSFPPLTPISDPKASSSDE